MPVRVATERKDAVLTVKRAGARDAICAQVFCARTVAANASAVTLFPAVKVNGII